MDIAVLGRGYRLLTKGEVIADGDEFFGAAAVWKPCRRAVGEQVDPLDHYPIRRKVTESTKKPKEQKTMTAKKHKPTAKASKYPPARTPEVVEYFVVKSKTTRTEVIGVYDETFSALQFQLGSHATTGTKLDRALVDLKEAKKRIKELERKMSGEIA